MKTVCALIALSACSSVAMADYILDPLTEDAHSLDFTYQHNTFPMTSSEFPALYVSRITALSIYGPTAATMSLGGGEVVMSWNTPAAMTNDFAIAMVNLQYNFNQSESLGASTWLSYAGSGSFSGVYTTAEVLVQLIDTSGRSVIWWVPFTPGAFTGLQLDITSTPHYGSPDFDPNHLSFFQLQFGFVQGLPGALLGGSGSITISQLQFIPAPGAAALMGLGGLAAIRRRR